MVDCGQSARVLTVGLNPAIDRVIEVPGFTIGGHQHGRLRSRSAAGKAANVSRALARLGVRNVAEGFVGAEDIEFFQRDLDSTHTNTRFLPVAGQTRENVTIVDPETNVETHIRDRGFTVTSEDVTRMLDELAQVCRPGQIVVFSGSLPPGMSVEDFRGMVELAGRQGARVAVDTNGPALAALADVPLWLIKPNRDELAELTGRSVEKDDDLVRAASGLSATIGTVLVSCGRAGGYAFVDGCRLTGRVPVDQRRVGSTVGCGDVMLAGFIAASLSGGTVADAHREALAVATASATSLVPGEFTDADLAEFRDAANVEPLGLPAAAGTGDGDGR